jgi:hypothetical protein
MSKILFTKSRRSLGRGLNSLEDYLDPREREHLVNLGSPAAIQAFLDEIPYSAEDANRCPLKVLQDRKAHCLDGALFAAAALRRLGGPPVVVDLLPEPGTDDDHVLAIYRRDGFWGAVAKSNFAGLRFREAIHRTLRELVLSYFEDFFNLNGQKTLRAYTVPLDLSVFDRDGWMWRNEGADLIEDRLSHMRRLPLLTPQMVSYLSPVDQRSYAAGMLGANPAGLYEPRSQGSASGK